MTWSVSIEEGRVVSTFKHSAYFDEKFWHPLSDWERTRARYVLDGPNFRAWRKEVMRHWKIAKRMKFLGA